MHARTPVVFSLVGLALVAYAGWLGFAGATPFEYGATLVIAAAAVLSILASAMNKPRMQRGVASGLLLITAALIASKFVDMRLLRVDLFHDARYASFLIGLLVLTVVGLFLRLI